MAATQKKDDVQVSLQNISYYNAIAADYDAILKNDITNRAIRERVAELFTSHVKAGIILDFGGGTGQDLSWQQHYQIIFCEPSPAMRQVAIERNKNEFPGASISFLEDNKTDFRKWNTHFPFENKVDAILANFAVVNCVPDINLLFEKFALVLKQGGTVMAVFLDNSLTKRLRSNLKGTLRSFFSGDPVNIMIEYNGQQQLVYIHSMNAFKKAWTNHFIFVHLERLYGFYLLHLVRK
jgi:SAM-dependent methyltransferase